MTQTRISFWFLRENYEAIRSLLPNEPNLPATFDEWQQAASKQIAELEAAGIAVRKAIINPEQFSAWCRASGIDHNIETLRAFAVAVDRKNREGRA